MAKEFSSGNRSPSMRISCKKIHQSLVEKIRPGETKSDDYAFLVLETDKTLKKSLEDYLTATNITTLEGIDHSMFYFNATS